MAPTLIQTGKSATKPAIKIGLAEVFCTHKNADARPSVAGVGGLKFLVHRLVAADWRLCG